jgi:hypothetical protein
MRSRCNEDWQAIECSKNGWAVVDDVLVKFVRRDGIRPTRQGRGGRVKKEAHCAGNVDCRPYLALRHPAARSTLAIPTCPRGAKGPGTMLNQSVGQLTTQRPSRRA